jgi:hypothetical protein
MPQLTLGDTIDVIVSKVGDVQPVVGATTRIETA